ncbi:MAG: methyltransferase domain-containing protein [Pyrinomonadaceae bacterium]
MSIMSPSLPSIVPNSDKRYPPSLLPSLRDVNLVCPLCHRGLDLLTDRDGYYCPGCERGYPLHTGIPDFRVFPCPYLSFQEDHDRTEIVLAALERYQLEGLLEYYWTFSDITPPALRSNFIRSAMLGEQRAQCILRSFADGTFQQPIRAQRVLELGSCSGNFLALATEYYDQVIGIDIGMRWLHVSRRRFMDKGLPVPALVCCCAEYLPFPDNSFDLVVGASTLEFVRDPKRVLAESARTLKEGGSLYIQTVNRYSLATNPYAYLWGVGFLPRAWQARYVRWRRGASYDSVRLLSMGELKRMAGEYFRSIEFALQNIDPTLLRQFSPFTRFQARVYQSVRKLPLIRTILRLHGPGWEVALRK